MICRDGLQKQPRAVFDDHLDVGQFSFFPKTVGQFFDPFHGFDEFGDACRGVVSAETLLDFGQQFADFLTARDPRPAGIYSRKRVLRGRFFTF